MADETLNRKIQHLYSRFGFGAAPDYFFSGKSLDDHIDYIIADASFIAPIAPPKKVSPRSFYLMSREERAQTRKEQKTETARVNFDWLNIMGSGRAALREKLALFWHDHFACNSDNSYFMYEYMQVLRSGALGNFRQLLEAVSKSSAMLQFLNNQQNRKDQPNENFAREVMELFTLGRGNYTEADIREAARAFTGWGFNTEGDYVLRRFAHDNGAKTIFGETGYFWGEDVLDIILARPETSTFICGKFYDFFVNENVRDEKHIESMADVFVNSNYEILPVIEFILHSEWFWDKQNIGTRIKSPVELLAGMQQMLHVDYSSPEETVKIQHALGQVLLNPPSVSGWPMGKQWIDSSRLLMRMALPKAIIMKSKLQDTSGMLPQKLSELKAVVDIDELNRLYAGLAPYEIGRMILLVEPNPVGAIKDPFLYFVSQPEFQMC